MQGVEAPVFHGCTPIQAQCLPLALTGRDVAGQAQTGTGKTAASCSQAMNHLLRNAPRSGRVKDANARPDPGADRELAFRSTRTHCCWWRTPGCGWAWFYGGTGYDSQRKQLEEAWTF